MTQPVPEETNAAKDLTSEPPGEHDSELPDESDQSAGEREAQEENAETTLDQPSQ